MKNIKSIILISAVLTLSGCVTNQKKPEQKNINSWMSEYSDFSFDNFLNDYLATNPITSERVEWYINTFKPLREEYDARKESGVGFENFVKNIETQIKLKKAIGKYSSFHKMNFYDYDRKNQQFNLLERDGIGTLETFWNKNSESTNRNTPGWFKITARTDIRGWKWKVPPEQALQIIANKPDRELYAFVTYDLKGCESTQDTGQAKSIGSRLGEEYSHLIFCDLKATSIRFYNTTTIGKLTQPFAVATYVQSET